MNKILIIGGASILGESITNMLNREYDISVNVVSAEDYVDIYGYRNNWIKTDKWEPEHLASIALKINPTVIINCLTTDDIMLSDSNVNLIKKINIAIHQALIDASKLCESKYVCFSHETIFDGKNGYYSELDMNFSNSIYANILIEKEKLLRDNYQNYLLFRTTNVFGFSNYDKSDIISTYSKLLSNANKLEFTEIILTNPIYSNDVALAVAKALERDRTGLYHLGGLDYKSQYEIAQMTAKVYDFDNSLIEIIEGAKTTKYGLNNLKAQTDLRVSFTSLENALIAMKFNSSDGGFYYL